MTYMLTFSVRKCLVLNQNLNTLNRYNLKQNMARPTGIEPVTYGLAYHYNFHCRHRTDNVCGLDYIFTFTGGTRIVSTDPVGSLPGNCTPPVILPWQATAKHISITKRLLVISFLGIANAEPKGSAVRFHRYSVLHSNGSVSR